MVSVVLRERFMHELLVAADESEMPPSRTRDLVLPRLAGEALVYGDMPSRQLDLVGFRLQDETVRNSRVTDDSQAAFGRLWESIYSRGIEQLPTAMLRKVAPPFSHEQREYLYSLGLSSSAYQNIQVPLGCFLAMRPEDGGNMGICVRDEMRGTEDGVRVLAHEYGHGITALLGVEAPVIELDEIIAETCGFAVAESFGFDRIDFSASYLGHQIKRAAMAGVGMAPVAQAMVMGATFGERIIEDLGR